MHVATLPARRRLPFVFVNMALTADGKIATADRRLSSFGSARDLQHLYELRATADAVMCGARTLMESNATLGTGGERFQRRRLAHGLAREPVRVLVSGSGSLDLEARVFTRRGGPLVILTTRRAGKRRTERLREVADEVVVCGERTINWPAALSHLRASRGIRRLLGEGGGELNDALFRAGLVDELHLTLCPLIFGGRMAPTLADGEGFSTLSEAARFRVKSARRVGNELFCVLVREP